MSEFVSVKVVMSCRVKYYKEISVGVEEFEKLSKMLESGKIEQEDNAADLIFKHIAESDAVDWYDFYVDEFESDTASLEVK